MLHKGMTNSMCQRREGRRGRNPHKQSKKINQYHKWREGAEGQGAPHVYPDSHKKSQ